MFGRRRQVNREDDPATVVAQSWRQVLDASSLAADVPFDQAGGDSLRLLKLIFLMEEATGLRLPMEACHVGLRPGEFAQVVQRAMQTAGDAAKEPPGTIFLIPGMGGESTLEGGFRVGCAPDLNIATIDLPDWPAMIAGDYTMASLVRQTVAEIDARSSTGPVRLVGFSLGGHVAFAVAQALVALGREVSFLGILDTNTARLKPPEAHGPAPIRMVRRIRWQLHNLAQAARRGETADRMGLIVAEFLTRPGKPSRRRLATRLQQMPMPANLAMFVNIYLRDGVRPCGWTGWAI